jgi:predicted O-methyltransferase YrrM
MQHTETTFLLPEVTEAIHRAGSDHIPTFGGTHEGGYCIQQVPEELAQLICLCAAFGPFASSLEIGTAAGGTTRIMRDYVAIGSTVVIDDGRHPKFPVWQNDNRQHIGNLSEFIGDSHSDAANDFLVQLNRKYDLVGIDGDHSEAGVRMDWNMVRPFLQSGAIVWFHDIRRWDGVAALWEELKASHTVLLETDVLGIGAIRYVPSQSERRTVMFKDLSGQPAIHQVWRRGIACISGVEAPLYRRPPRVAMVIGTYAAVPYVHLQLEARRRFFSHVPVLTHDDASSKRDELESLCREYGCDFETNTSRFPHHLGDLSAFFGGLRWAVDNEFDLLLKVSRRWVFLTDWTDSLSRLALESQYATFSNHTSAFDFGFRTECMAMAVKLWGTPQIFQSLAEHIHCGRHVFVEAYMHHLAVEIEKMKTPDSDRWRSNHPTEDDRRGYAAWELMGTSRCSPEPIGTHLWHDCHTPADYARVASDWGLPYTEADFVDANQGEGIGKGNVR